MITTDYAVDTAARAAGVAITRTSTEPWWQQHADRPLKPVALANFIIQEPGAPADALYRFAAGRRVYREPWEGLAAEVRVAFEVFRASFLALLAIARADAAEAAEKARTSSKPPPNSGMGRRFGMVPAQGQRHVMSRTPRRRDFAVSAPLEPSTAGAAAQPQDEPAVMGLEDEPAPAEPVPPASSAQPEAPAHSAPATAPRKPQHKGKRK